MFWVILIFTLFIFYIIGKVSTNVTQNTNTNQRRTQNEPSGRTQADLKREIKDYEIKGVFHQRLNLSDTGFFTGTAKTTYHSEDPNCIEVIRNDGKLLGYFPRGNHRLHKSIREWHDGSVKVWGYIGYEEYKNQWDGRVYIPLGLPEKIIEDIFNVFLLESENKKILHNSNLRKSDIFFTLDNHISIREVLKQFPKNKVPYNGYPGNIIPSFSKKLEEQKDWYSLIKLEDYPDVLNEMSERFKNTTLKRIEKAKQLTATPHN